MWKFLDIFFLVFHSALILFNLFGWIFKKTRRLNLITLLLTGLSWFVLGIFYGMGYCPLTDWHFEVLDKLGRNSQVSSYVQYLIDRLFNINISAGTADIATMAFYFAALLLSVYANFFRHYFHTRRKDNK